MCGNRRSRLQGKNGGICVMMSNSTLPLGFLHSNTVGQFDDYMAKSYYIDGLRGEAKKISLPRNLVVWE